MAQRWARAAEAAPAQRAPAGAGPASKRRQSTPAAPVPAHDELPALLFDPAPHDPAHLAPRGQPPAATAAAAVLAVTTAALTAGAVCSLAGRWLGGPAALLRYAVVVKPLQLWPLRGCNLASVSAGRATKRLLVALRCASAGALPQPARWAAAAGRLAVGGRGARGAR